MSYRNNIITVKICLVTGATSGIGKVTATELAKAGAYVIVHGRNRQKAEAVRLEIIQLSGHQRVNILVGDLFSLSETRRMADEINAGYPRMDVLVKNAGGIMGPNREQTADGIEKTIAVNHL